MSALLPIAVIVVLALLCWWFVDRYDEHIRQGGAEPKKPAPAHSKLARVAEEVRKRIAKGFRRSPGEPTPPKWTEAKKEGKDEQQPDKTDGA